MAPSVPVAQTSSLPREIQRILQRHDLRSASGQEEAWRALLRGPFARRGSFDDYHAAFRQVYAARDAHRDGPGPVWFPPPDARERTHVGRWMQERGLPDYAAFHRWSATQRDQFWQDLLARTKIPLRKPPTAIRSGDVLQPEWLPGAELNIAEAALQGPASQTAMLYGREGSEELRRWSHAELRAMVDRVVHGLDRLGLGERDRIVLYLPLTPEAVAAYFGIVKSGRVAVGVADASAAPDLEKRVRISQARLLITTDGYLRDGKFLRVYEKAKEANAPPCIVLPAEGADAPSTSRRPQDKSWSEFLGPERPAPARIRKASDESNILFSSGTTKDPKAIVWTHTTPLKCIADAHVHQDVQADDVVAWPTSFGWMMGPWLAYSSLCHGATLALYNGSPLVAGFGRFVQDAKVTMLGVVPKIVRAWRTARSMEAFDWSRVRRFSSTGETSDPDDMLYLSWLAGTKPVVEYCGGTEIAGGYLTGTMVQPAAPAAFTTPTAGLDFCILDEAGRPTQRGEVGLVPPSIGFSNRILNYDHQKEYYEGFFRGPNGEALRRHGDQIERLGRGYYKHHGRLDDMINLNGVKTSVEEVRGVIGHHPLVYDTKPISVDVEGKGQRVLVVYAIPKDRSRLGDETLRATLRAEFSRLIKERLNPLLSHVHDVVLVADLPQAGPGKTRTQKEFLADYQSRLASTRPAKP